MINFVIESFLSSGLHGRELRYSRRQ